MLVEIQCRWCGKSFCICRRCWRGQSYCSEECRRSGRNRLHREAQRRYRQTPRGKKAHRQAENRRRHEINHSTGKKMDDPSSRAFAGRAMEVLTTAQVGPKGVGRCHFCGRAGRLVDRFPRRE